jgi:hypothetical protein
MVGAYSVMRYWVLKFVKYILLLLAQKYITVGILYL